jgi:hypothetical protein
MDLKTAVPLDAQALLDQAKVGATVNETEGWVQNLNAANLQAQLTQYQSQVQTYITAQNPSATVGDVLGTKQIIAQSPSILMGTLPYKTIVTGAKFAVIPDNLKHQFHFNLYDSALDRALDSPTLTFTKNLPYLAGKKLTLSFTPASQADLDLINSYLPKPHADGTPIQPSELPTSLPGYLIHLKAEIRVDGQIATEGGSYIMGQELTSGMGLNAPGRGWDDSEDNHPIAGEYEAIGLDMQGISASQLGSLKAKLEQTKAILELQNASDISLIQSMTKEDLSGDFLYAGILSYFSNVDSGDQLAVRTRKQVVSYRMPSYGIFMAAAQPHYWFGISRSVSFPGVVMDVDRITYHVEAMDADNQKKIAYLRQVGSAGSGFENAVPERMFADTTKPLNDPSQPQGVSAVKVLAIAASQGQKIYTLNQHNQALHPTILAQIIIDPEARAEILNALAAGKEVTVHASPITQSGWTGSGYTVLDPDTGAGAYKISGGANGGALLNVLTAGLGGLVDSLVEKLRDPNSMFGPYSEIKRSYWLKLAAKAATILTFIKAISDILSNNSLTPMQQSAQIFAALAFTIAANVLAGAIGGFFAAPAVGVFLAITLVVILALINEWVNEEIALL